MNKVHASATAAAAITDIDAVFPEGLCEPSPSRPLAVADAAASTLVPGQGRGMMETLCLVLLDPQAKDGEGSQLSTALDCARAQGYGLVGLRGLCMSDSLAAEYATLHDTRLLPRLRGRPVVAVALQRDNAVTCSGANLLAASAPTLRGIREDVLFSRSVEAVRATPAHTPASHPRALAPSRYSRLPPRAVRVSCLELFALCVSFPPLCGLPCLSARAASPDRQTDPFVWSQPCASHRARIAASRARRHTGSLRCCLRCWRLTHTTRWCREARAARATASAAFAAHCQCPRATQRQSKRRLQSAEQPGSPLPRTSVRSQTAAAQPRTVTLSARRGTIHPVRGWSV